MINKGDVEQMGSPHEVYEQPTTPFVFDFLGQANRFEGQHQQGMIHIGENRILWPQASAVLQSKIVAFSRPNELRIHTTPQDNSIQAAALCEIWIAGEVLVELQDDQGNLIEIVLHTNESKQYALKPNQTMWLSPTALHLFANEVA